MRVDAVSDGAGVKLGTDEGAAGLQPVDNSIRPTATSKKTLRMFCIVTSNA
jgi:hypothetical protein